MKLNLRQPLGFVHGCGIDENHVLLFGLGSKKSRGMAAELYHYRLVIDSD